MKPYETFEEEINAYISHENREDPDRLIRDFIYSFIDRSALTEYFSFDYNKFGTETINNDDLPYLKEMTWLLANLEYWESLIFAYYTEKESNFSGQTKIHNKRDPKGFKNTLQPYQVELLYNELKDNYIKKDTNPDHFKAIFVDDYLPKDFHQIKWLQSNILLSYFIAKSEFITDNSKWKKASSIFGTKENLQQSLNNNQYPKGYEGIDSLLSKI